MKSGRLAESEEERGRPSGAASDVAVWTKCSRGTAQEETS